MHFLTEKNFPIPKNNTASEWKNSDAVGFGATDARPAPPVVLARDLQPHCHLILCHILALSECVRAVGEKVSGLHSVLLRGIRPPFLPDSLEVLSVTALSSG